MHGLNNHKSKSYRYAARVEKMKYDLPFTEISRYLTPSAFIPSRATDVSDASTGLPLHG